MLSSTADHLFWMARYSERAENTARMLDIHLQSSLLAGGRSEMQRGQAARAVLLISELVPAYEDAHSGQFSMTNARRSRFWLVTYSTACHRVIKFTRLPTLALPATAPTRLSARGCTRCRIASAAWPFMHKPTGSQAIAGV